MTHTVGVDSEHDREMDATTTTNIATEPSHYATDTPSEPLKLGGIYQHAN